MVFTYDDARRLTRISDSLGNAIHFTLDTEGNFTARETFDTHGVLRESLSQTFDLYNRLDQFNQVHGDRDLDFAADGTLDRETDGSGTVTDYNYDALQRLTHVIADAGGANGDTADTTTSYDYDIASRLTQVTDPKGNTTTYVYDDLGNLLSQTSPDTGASTYRYDTAGNLLSHTNALDQTTTYRYDALNRVDQIDYADGSSQSYSYAAEQHPRVRLSVMDDGVSQTSYIYTAFDQLASQTQTVDGVTLSLSYDYNAAGQWTQLDYPSGRVLTASYEDGLLSALHLDGQALASAISYHPFGPPQSWTWGNGSTYVRSYGLDGRLTHYPLGASEQTLSYNSVGDLKTQSDPQAPGQEHSYGYDALSQLRDYSAPATTEAYAYDANGNRTQHDVDSESHPYTVEAQSNRLVTVAGPQAHTYTLDAIGNTLSDSVHTYTYNATQHLAGVDGQHSYDYNGLWQRLRKTNHGVPTYFIYGQNGQLLGEYDGAGQPQREHIYLGDQPLATLGGSGTAAPALDFNSHPLVPFVRSQDKAGQATVEDGGAAVRISGNAWKRIDLAYTVTPDTVLELDLTVVQPGEIHAIGLADSTSQTADKAFNLYGSETSWGLLTYAGQYPQEGTTVSYRIAVGQHYTGAVDRLFFINDHDVATPTAETVFANVRIYEDSTGAGTPHYIYTDHLNTPRAIMDDSGTVVWRWTADPFGAMAPDEDPDGDGQAYVYNGRFPGQYYDAETGLHYNYHRYYDPSTGRYITSDPIGLAGGLNTYGYVGGNPLSWSDPLGLYFWGAAGRVGTTVLPVCVRYPSLCFTPWPVTIVWAMGNGSSDDGGDSSFPPGSQSTPALPPPPDDDGPEQCLTRDLVPTHGRTMSNRQFNELVRDIHRNGMQSPILYVEHNGVRYVVDGHHRLLAAQRLGMRHVPVQRVNLPFRGYRGPADLNFTP